MAMPVKDMTGLRFGLLTVVRRHGSKTGQAAWWCDCDCGVKGHVVRGGELRKGEARSCGCRAGRPDAEAQVPGDFRPGDRFGRWTVVARDERAGPARRWRVRCDCGGESVVDTNSLRRGGSQSCGCLNAETTGAAGAKLLAGKPSAARVELAGRVVGGLLVVRRTDRRHPKSGASLWECSCACGNTHFAQTTDLTRGRVRSCGCGRLTRG